MTEPTETTRRCPACDEEIRSTARKCKHCGEWLSAQPNPTVIEQTDKAWKAVQLIGGLAACAGGALLGAEAPEAGIGLLAGGALLFLFGRLGAWWHHA